MRLLLDTHALLWWLADMPQLGPAARARIEQGENAVFVSAVSAWEIEIKRALGKLNAPGDLAAAIKTSHLEPLSMTIPHAITAGQLPRHHDDPFDRMLIAQAMIEELAIVTQDGAFRDYNISLIDAQA